MFSRALGIGSLALAIAIGIAGTASAQEYGACDGVTCSDHGQCFDERGRALCLCDEGFAAQGIECVRVAPAHTAGRSPSRDEIAARIIEVAVAQNGAGRWGVGRTLETYPYDLARYLGRNEWWCADFVAWAYRVGGAPFTGGYEGGWLVKNNEAMAVWFAQRGRFVSRGSTGWRSFTPRPGDFVRFATARGGHAAIVTRVDGDTVYTIEGNVGEHVALGRHRHFHDDPRVDGVGILVAPNMPPRVAVADLLEVEWPGAVSVAAVVDDDGPFEDLTVGWRVEEGPGEAAFDPPVGTETSVSFSEPGVYVLAVDAHDGQHAATATLVVDAWEIDPAEGPPAGAATCSISAARHGDESVSALVIAGLVIARGARRKRRTSLSSRAA